jgi:methylmalonyl-CoA/ethylmalonyl-CoA epimerase
VTSLHHVAIAHGDDPVCEDAFTGLLGAPTHEESAPGFLERMYPVGGAFVQTLEADGDGVVQRFLDRRGPGLHHIAFAVDAIDAALTDLEARGVTLIDKEARPGGMGTRIAFLHPSAMGGVLVELVEETTGTDRRTRDG